MLKRLSNPGLGRKFYFFGKFKSLILARRSEREHPKSFILQRGGFYYVLEPKARRNPKSTGVRQTFRHDIERVGGKWYIVDHTGFSSHPIEIVKGPFESRIEAKDQLRILKSRSRYTMSKRHWSELGFRTKYKGGQKPHQRNPGGTLIYGRVLKIFAQKTSGPYKGQRFVHTFKKGAIMIGKSDGSLVIKHS